MGTLFNQKPRYEASNIDKTNFASMVISDVNYYKREFDCSITEAIELCRLAMDMERMMFWMNGLDVTDEQLAGFGEIFSRMAAAFELIGEGLNRDPV